MKNPVLRVLFAVVGVAVMILGIRQVLGAGGMPTREEAKGVAVSAAANLTEYTNKEHGISLQYPKGWTTAEPKDGLLFFGFKTLSGAVNANVMSQEVAPGTMLFEYVERNVVETEAALKQQNAQPRTLSRDKVVVGTEPGMVVRYAFLVPGEDKADKPLPVRVSQVFVLHGNRAYAITLTTPEEWHDDFGELLTKILASVKFV